VQKRERDNIRQQVTIWAIWLTTCGAILFALALPPIGQPLWYHQFADSQPMFGIPNGWNVISNIGFLAVGLLGLIHVHQGHLTFPAPLKWAYLVLFASITLISLGSSYYHLAPDNGTLFWDRLPMATAFMALFTIVIGEYISLSAAKRLLIPFLAIGAFSVIYWHLTEIAGQGDLRLYGLVQFLPLCLMPMILIGFSSTFSHQGFYWVLLLCYMVAKLCEVYDQEIFDQSGLISGHSLKHIIATIGLSFLYLGYRQRTAVLAGDNR